MPLLLVHALFQISINFLAIAPWLYPQVCWWNHISLTLNAHTRYHTVRQYSILGSCRLRDCYLIFTFWWLGIAKLNRSILNPSIKFYNYVFNKFLYCHLPSDRRPTDQQTNRLINWLTYLLMHSDKPDHLADSCKRSSVNRMAAGSRLSWCIVDFSHICNFSNILS